MNLTKKQLKEILKEELQNILPGNVSENLGAQRELTSAVGALATVISTQSGGDVAQLADAIMKFAMELAGSTGAPTPPSAGGNFGI